MGKYTARCEVPQAPHTLRQTLAIIIGAAYYNLPLNAAGAFTRGSVIFVALLTCCLDTFGEARIFINFMIAGTDFIAYN